MVSKSPLIVALEKERARLNADMESAAYNGSYQGQVIAGGQVDMLNRIEAALDDERPGDDTITVSLTPWELAKLSAHTSVTAIQYMSHDAMGGLKDAEKVTMEKWITLGNKLSEAS